MGQRYDQISIRERCDIARLRAEGQSIRQIASTLDRSPSTVTREVKRNSGSQGEYQPMYADEQCRARRWTGSKMDRDPELRNLVVGLLAKGWSPEQVVNRLQRELGTQIISHETIYRFIYAQIARTKDYRWRRLLPRGKSKRGWYGRRGGSPASLIALRCPVRERPKTVESRRASGHWEVDLMLFSTYGQGVLVLHERYSRLLLVSRPAGKDAQPIAQAIKEMLGPLPAAWRQTVTFDNGTEFALHYELHDIGTETYFCDTHSPWQKGGVENAIGRMRRKLPRKTDLRSLSDERLTSIVQEYNNTPRKCLDYQTPAEVFWGNLLHFKCESIFPPARE